MKIDCKTIRNKILEEVKKETQGKNLSLCVIQVGDDDASNIYIRNKIKICEECDIMVEHFNFDENTTFELLKKDIDFLKNFYDGMMIQLPLPPHLKEHEQELLDLIPWYMDIDGLSTESVGRLWNNQPCLKPCTAQAVLSVMPSDLAGKNVLLLGRSKLVGKPLIKMILDRNGTPTIAHSKSEYHFAMHDYIVSAINKPKHFDLRELRDDQTFIDVSINRDNDGKLCGDLDTTTNETYWRDMDGNEDIDVCDADYTPVPNGIGILTTAFVVYNVLEARKLREKYD